MTDLQLKAIEMIEAQQKKLHEGEAAWVVGEQLKELCCAETFSAELLVVDLTAEGMGIVDAEKKIKAHADKNRKGNFAYVSPQKAEEILREFYGLPSAAQKNEACFTASRAQTVSADVIDLGEFF